MRGIKVQYTHLHSLTFRKDILQRFAFRERDLGSVDQSLDASIQTGEGSKGKHTGNGRTLYTAFGKLNGGVLPGIRKQAFELSATRQRSGARSNTCTSMTLPIFTI